MNKKVFMLCMIVALLCMLLFEQGITECLVRLFVAPMSVELTVDGKNIDSQSYEVWITGVSGRNILDLEEVIENASRQEGFEYRSAQEYGYLHDVIVNNGRKDSALNFSLYAGKRNTITFWKQNLSGIVILTTKYGQKKIDLYSALTDEYVQVDLFSKEAGIRYCLTKLFLQFLLWACNLLMVLLIYCLRSSLKTVLLSVGEYLRRGKYRVVIYVCLLILYTVLLIWLYFAERR